VWEKEENKKTKSKPRKNRDAVKYSLIVKEQE